MPRSDPSILKARRLTLTCIAASAVLAGCSSTDSYVETVNEVQADVLKAENAVSTDVNASRNEVLSGLEAAQNEAESAVEELKEVDVPADAEEGHADLVAAYKDLGELLAGFREDVESENGIAFSNLGSEARKIEKEIDQAIEQINSDLGLE